MADNNNNENEVLVRVPVNGPESRLWTIQCSLGKSLGWLPKLTGCPLVGQNCVAVAGMNLCLDIIAIGAVFEKTGEIYWTQVPARFSRIGLMLGRYIATACESYIEAKRNNKLHRLLPPDVRLRTREGTVVRYLGWIDVLRCIHVLDADTMAPCVQEMTLVFGETPVAKVEDLHLFNSDHDFTAKPLDTSSRSFAEVSEEFKAASKCVSNCS